MGLLPKISFGDYPAEYNPKVHGPYDPGRFYGKPDTPFGQVKLADISEWISRRDKSTRGITRCISRAYWRWQHKYVFPKRTNGAYFIQIAVIGMLIYYPANFGKQLVHRHSKYH